MVTVDRPAAWSTLLAAQIGERLIATFNAAADPHRAPAMRAYMRDQFPFLGIPAPRRRLLFREVLSGLAAPTEADLRVVALACWELPEREYQYFACSLLERHVRTCSASFVTTLRQLIVTRSWWDTVDPLAANVVGPLVTRHPALSSTMDSWARDSDTWLVRAALTHQLRYRDATATDRLLSYCELQADNPEFFIRKAIGWALREYARTDPDSVRAFVHAQRARLAPLTVREALRNL